MIVETLMDKFQSQCMEKVNDRTVEFGPCQLETGCYVLCQDVFLITSSLGSNLLQPVTVHSFMVKE